MHRAARADSAAAVSALLELGASVDVIDDVRKFLPPPPHCHVSCIDHGLSAHSPLASAAVRPHSHALRCPGRRVGLSGPPARSWGWIRQRQGPLPPRWRFHAGAFSAVYVHVPYTAPVRSPCRGGAPRCMLRPPLGGRRASRCSSLSAQTLLLPTRCGPRGSSLGVASSVAAWNLYDFSYFYRWLGCSLSACFLPERPHCRRRCSSALSP